METPAAGNAMMLGISQEMSELKIAVRGLVTEVRQSRSPGVPEPLVDHYQSLIENQVAEEIASEIVRGLSLQARPDLLKHPVALREKLALHLERLVPTAGPIRRTKPTGAHVVALIGPTGVGKTTTVAKLAANLQLRERQKVGLITLDTYRIAAVEQLRKYAEIIGSPLKVVSSPEEMKDAVAALADRDFILIDTAGRSPNDALKLSELRRFLEAAAPDEVHLVLSTTASQCSVDLAVERFSQVRVDRVLFTKLDEAAHVGVVFNVVRRLNKSLSYITTGQDVPDDIEVGHGRRLAQLVLGMTQNGRAGVGVGPQAAAPGGAMPGSTPTGIGQGGTTAAGAGIGGAVHGGSR